MEVKQIYEIMNTVTNEVIGKSDIVAEDLSNVADVGTEIFNASAVDNYVKSLVNRIGKVIFVNRPYNGNVPSIMVDAWEFGSVAEKIRAEMPDAVTNPSWSLKDGDSVSNDVFHAPKVSAKFYNNKATFEVPMSFTERQVKESFGNAAELNAFLSMITNSVEKSMTVKINGVIMELINNMTAETINADYPVSGEAARDLTAKSGIKAVNLLKLYNDTFGETLTKDKALTTPAFIRFAAMTISMYADRLKNLSTLFNVDGKDTFTPSDYLHTVLLSNFKTAAGVYLAADTYHENYVALPESETVSYWQGTGTGYTFDSVSRINVKTASGASVDASGIIGVMFDRDAVMVTNPDRRVTTAYNAHGEYFNSFFKFDVSSIADLSSNYIVFLIA